MLAVLRIEGSTLERNPAGVRASVLSHTGSREVTSVVMSELASAAGAEPVDHCLVTPVWHADAGRSERVLLAWEVRVVHSSAPPGESVDRPSAAPGGRGLLRRWRALLNRAG